MKTHQTIKMRNSNLELLRILAMVLITFNHITTYGQTLNGVFDSNAILSLIFLLGGKFGCNIFVILSSWFLADSNFKIRRIVEIWLQTFIYQAVLYIINILFFYKKPTIMELFRNISVLGGHYWYPRAYICMLLFIPIIKYFVPILEKQKYFWLIFLGGLFLSVYPTITFEGALLSGFNFIQKIMNIVMFEPLFQIIWFCYLFALTYYIKMYIRMAEIPCRVFGLVFMFCYLLMFIIELVLYSLGTNFYSTIRNLESLPCVIGAFALFFFFKSFPIKNNPVINKLSNVWGTYLIQCHVPSIPIIWGLIFPIHIWKKEKTIIFLFFSVITVLVIISTGIILNTLYDLIAEKCVRCVIKKKDDRKNNDKIKKIKFKKI